MTHTLRAAAVLALLAGPAAAQEIKVAMNGVDDPETNAEAAFVEGFQDALEGTDFTVEVFPSGTLGSEDERFDQVAQGLVQVNLATVSTAFGMSPLMKGVLLPFMFEGADEFDALMEGSDLMAQMNEPLLPNGVRLAGFNYIGTGIGIHNTERPITKMSDLEGLRFRALNTEQLAYQEALGASGTIVAWSEVPNAIQTGIADGYFNPPNSAIRTGHTEFLRHFTQADISPSTRAVLISEDWHAGLTDEERARGGRGARGRLRGEPSLDRGLGHRGARAPRGGGRHDLRARAGRAGPHGRGRERHLGRHHDRGRPRRLHRRARAAEELRWRRR